MKDFNISVGFYPGVLLGVRTYKKEMRDNEGNIRLVLHHVLYIPFFDLCLTIEK